MSKIIRKKELKKQIELLTEELNNLKNIVITDELKRLKIVEEQYKEQTELLSSVRFKVKSIKITEENDEPSGIVIIYQLPIINIALDEKGDPLEKNKFFYSVNALGLIDFNDCELLNRTFEKAKFVKSNKIN